jgi:hypothetical protein
VLRDGLGIAATLAAKAARRVTGVAQPKALEKRAFVQ